MNYVALQFKMQILLNKTYKVAAFFHKLHLDIYKLLTQPYKREPFGLKT